MPTFVTLTRVHSVEKTSGVWVNLDQVRSMRRLPSFPATDFCKELPERTRLEFAVSHGDGLSDAFIDVMETPAQVCARGREESGWCR